MGPAVEWVVGRDAELATIAGFVEGVEAGPRALLLEGEPGIGKTTLWEAALNLARDTGYQVLSCRPAEIETSFSYAALGDLLHDHLDDAIGPLVAPQRRALEIALLRLESGGNPPDQRAVALAVLHALGALSRQSPLIVAIDDVQWLDRSSARSLAFAIRRLREARTGILASLRLAPGIEDPLDLRSALGDGGTVRLRLGPLGAADLGRMMRRRLGRSLPHPLAARVHKASHGNPLFALEIVRALEDSGATPGQPLPAPDDLQAALGARVARLSQRTKDLLLLASAMARPTMTSLRAVTAPGDEVAAELTEAQEEGIVTVERDRIRFAHPLLATAVYWSTLDEGRRDAHARLAEVSPKLEERARHLALAARGPDPDAAAIVEEAAERVYERGAPSDAAELYELARDLTPAEDLEAISHRGRMAGMRHYAAGDVGRAKKILTELVSSLPHGRNRAYALASLATICWNDITRIRELLLAALEEATEAGGDDEVLGYIQMNLSWAEVFGGSLTRAIENTSVAIPLLTHPVYVRLALGALGHAQSLMGLNANDTMQRAMSIEVPLGPGEIGTARALRARQVLWAGRVAEARDLLLEVDRMLIDQGLELHRHDTCLYLAEVECAAGNWALAERYAEEAYDIVFEAGYRESLDQVLYARARVASLLGRTEPAERDALDGLARSEAQGCLFAELQNRSVLGFLELSLGRHAEAVEFLDPVPEILEQMGVREPGAFPCLPDLIEALVATGDLERAKALTQRLEEQGKALDRPLALATAARCRALLAAALGDLPGAVLELDHALEEHERIAMPFELARTQLVRGEALRRMKRKRPAREALDAALATFEELRAPLWAQRARTALSRIGGRPATPTELTATEKQVADLVAKGRTNKEVADELFMSVKTVEANLRRIYQKLGVRSRTELAGAWEFRSMSIVKRRVLIDSSPSPRP